VTTSWGVHASTSTDVGTRRRRDQCMTSSRRRQDVEFFDGQILTGTTNPVTILCTSFTFDRPRNSWL